MRFVVLGILLAAACTAPNPAFGDATTGTSLSTDATSDTPPGTSNTNGETTRGDESTTRVATSTTGDDPSVVTSDDENSVSDSDPIYDLGGEDESTTESGPRRLWLFTAAVDGGAFGDPAGKLSPGVEQCADAYESLALDMCDMPPVPMLRADMDPFENRALADYYDREVHSIDGDLIADTLKKFVDGDWALQTLYDATGGGLEELAQMPLATGGRTNADSNCGGWLDSEDDMTLGDPDGEEGWFAVDEISCASPARILCICPGA